MNANLKSFCELVPSAERPLVVYSGDSMSGVASHYADTENWLA